MFVQQQISMSKILTGWIKSCSKIQQLGMQSVTLSATRQTDLLSLQVLEESFQSVEHLFPQHLQPVMHIEIKTYMYMTTHAWPPEFNNSLTWAWLADLYTPSLPPKSVTMSVHIKKDRHCN